MDVSKNSKTLPPLVANIKLLRIACVIPNIWYVSYVKVLYSINFVNFNVF